MPASKAQQAATAARRTKAIALRMAGVDYETIADRLDYASRQAAAKDVRRALEEYRAEETAAIEAWRELEGQRLDRLQAAAWSAAAKGDLKAIETVLKVMAQRSKLLGLEAEKQRNDADIDDARSVLGRLARGIAAVIDEPDDSLADPADGDG
jgi:hypothetical protein